MKVGPCENERMTGILKRQSGRSFRWAGYGMIRSLLFRWQIRREKVVDDLPYFFPIAHQMNTQENKISWNSYLSFIIDGYIFLYIVLTLKGIFGINP
jgi:hypothetical protein